MLNGHNLGLCPFKIKTKLDFLICVVAFKEIYVWIPTSWESIMEKRFFCFTIIYFYEVENNGLEILKSWDFNRCDL